MCTGGNVHFAGNFAHFVNLAVIGALTLVQDAFADDLFFSFVIRRAKGCNSFGGWFFTRLLEDVSCPDISDAAIESFFAIFLVQQGFQTGADSFFCLGDQSGVFLSQFDDLLGFADFSSHANLGFDDRLDGFMRQLQRFSH